MIRRLFGCCQCFFSSREIAEVAPMPLIASGSAFFSDSEVDDPATQTDVTSAVVVQMDIVSIGSVLRPILNEEPRSNGSLSTFAIFQPPFGFEKARGSLDAMDLSAIEIYADENEYHSDGDFHDYVFSEGYESSNGSQQDDKNSPQLNVTFQTSPDFLDRTPREDGWRYSPRGLNVKSDSSEFNKNESDDPAHQYATCFKMG